MSIKLVAILELDRFAALPHRLRRGIELMEWRLRHGLRWKWGENHDAT